MKYFANCDDDIKRFDIKFIREKLITQKIASFDAVMESMLRFMETAQIECASTSEAGAYIGGGNDQVLSGSNWSFTHLFLFSTESTMRFRAYIYDDYVFCCDYWPVGRRMFSTYLISHTVPSLEEAKKQSGGMRSTYNASNSYIAAFVPIMSHPDFCSVTYDKKHLRYKLVHHNENMRPKIISPTWRKADNDA